MCMCISISRCLSFSEDLEALHLLVDVAGLPIAAMPCCRGSAAVCFLGSNWSKSIFGGGGGIS